MQGRGYRGPSPDDVAELPEATAESLDHILATRPERLRLRIPGDVDRLARDDPGEAIRWRRELRDTLAALLTTKTARIEGMGDDPAAVGVRESEGDYAITGFATGTDAACERVNQYVLSRKPR